MTEEDFQAIYAACDVSRQPQPFVGEGVAAPAPADWWRALLVFAITTGWRIDEILSFRREDLDLETGRILTRAADNKGGRDSFDFLAPVALEHVRAIAGVRPNVFHWPHHRRTLDVEFHRIQETAGIRLTCRDPRRHDCTPACHLYGFHALRRGYATMNADRMPAFVVQGKMRHKSIQTTLRYIETANKMKAAADAVFVPEFLSTESKAARAR